MRWPDRALRLHLPVLALLCVAASLALVVQQGVRLAGPPTLSQRLQQRAAELQPLRVHLRGARRIGYAAWDPTDARLFQTQYLLAPTIVVPARGTTGLRLLLVETGAGERAALDRQAWREVARSGRFRLLRLRKGR